MCKLTDIAGLDSELVSETKSYSMDTCIWNHLVISYLEISGSVKLHIGDSWGRKVTTCKCPCINVLYVEMEPRMGDDEN